MTPDEIKRLNEVWLQGFISGLTEYAWLEGGEQYVGRSGTTLKQAIERAKKDYGVNTSASIEEGIRNLWET